MYFQLHRPLLCVLLLVWLIQTFLISMAAYNNMQLFLYVLNIPSGMSSKALILLVASSWPGKVISRPGVYWLIKNWTTTWGQKAAVTGSPRNIGQLAKSLLNTKKWFLKISYVSPLPVFFELEFLNIFSPSENLHLTISGHWISSCRCVTSSVFNSLSLAT